MLNRDSEYLAKLRDYYAEHRVLPSYSAVATLLGLRSTSAVAALVKRMKEAGFLDSGPGGRLQPGDRFFERPVSGNQIEGMPHAVNDAPIRGLNVDAYLVDQPSRTELLTVKEDSMIEAGLMPGDTVVVKKGAPTKPGDVVVAIVNNEFTVKYLAYDRHGFFLKPGNRAYAPIRSKDDLEIYGLVVGMFRKYPQRGPVRATG